MPKVCLYCARYDFEPLTITPLGIGYIAAYLIQQGIVSEDEIRIVDNLDKAIEFSPDILGVSSVSQVIHDARDFAKKCKERGGCLTILGGYHITAIPQKLPNEFDIGILGEGEKTFAEIVRLFKTNKLSKYSSQIKGICYRQDGEIVINKPRELIGDLDSLPWPYRHKEYSNEIPIFTSRGCPYKCIFCASHGFWGDKYRLRSADSVVSEIADLVNRYASEDIVINILDDLWIAGKTRFREIVQKSIELKIPEKTSFVGFCRSNILYEEEIKLLKQLNYKYIRFGAETGSEVLLKRLKGDNISIADHQRVINLCQKHKIPCGASFMFGVPGETKEDLEATITFLRKNKGKFNINGFYLFNPIPGTKIWAEMKNKKIITDDFLFENMQLDFLKENFSWGNILYFNQENVPLNEFQKYIHKIKAEFIDTSNKILVEVGSGNSPMPGYIHCDIHPAKSVDYACNAWAIPFKPESVYEIYARHMLEHLTYNDAERTLRHWLCILKVGGYIDLTVPDIQKHIEQFTKEGYSPYVSFKVTNKEHAMAAFYGWQNNEYDIHKWGWTFDALSTLLDELGYDNIKNIDDESLSGPLNLRIIAEKNRFFPNLKPDPKSLRPRWMYYNWSSVIRNFVNKLKSRKWILRTISSFRSIGTVFKKDYTGKGERQASPNLNEIRQDHVGRYKFACKFVNKNDVVLDVACGVGYGSFILAKETNLSKIIAVDKEKQAITFARKYYHDDKVTYRIGDIFSLDIPDDYFDCIVSFETVEHVDGSALVKLFYKRLKRGGLLIVSTPNQDTQPFNKKSFPFHLRHYTPPEFSMLLTLNGFEIMGKYTQYNRENEEVSEGWDGLFNIAIAKK